MARSKSKSEAKSKQLELFPQEQQVEAGQGREQSDAGQTEQQAEAAPPKKRTRTKKSPDQTIVPEAAATEQSAGPEEPIPSIIEEAPAPIEPVNPKQTEEKEARLKENFKKIQEERLAALRKARGKK